MERIAIGQIPNIPSGSNRWRVYEEVENKVECLCPGTMMDRKEDRNGDWMRIAHTTIIDKLVRCLAEWEEMDIHIAFRNNGESGNGNRNTPRREVNLSERIKQREIWLARGVMDQLQELAQFEINNRGLHCGVDVWPILVDYGWVKYQRNDM